MRRLLMVLRQASDECEAEPIVVDTDDPRLVVIELDDGERLEIDPQELRSAIESHPRRPSTHSGSLDATGKPDATWRRHFDADAPTPFR